MTHSFTRSFATLDISLEAYNEIRQKLLKAGYSDQVREHRGEEIVDMHGIAIRASADYDLSVSGNFHATLGTLPLPDILIGQAPSFIGWGPKYLQWSKQLWMDPDNGVPDHDLSHNAYHCRQLAIEMRLQGKWIGSPLMLKRHQHNGRVYVLDGNHRLRAVQWLEVQGVHIDIIANRMI